MHDWAAHLRPRLERLRLDGARAVEIVEELSQHLDQRFDELRAQGVDPDTARRRALDELDAPDALAEQLAPLRQATVTPLPAPGAPRTALWRDVWLDLRYALRMLRTQPVFALVVILTLALGIGANSAIFALVDATLLRPLPFPAPSRLVQVWERTASAERAGVSPLNLLDWADRSDSFEAIGAYVPNVGGMVLGDTQGLPDTVSRQWVTAGVFTALDVPPLVGRTFIEADDVEQRNVVVLSERVWRERFAGDAAVVGRTLRLDGEPFTVVGVMPQAAQVIGRTDLWALVSIRGIPPAARGQHPFVAIGRLRDGVGIEAAQDDLAAVAAGLAREHPETNAGRDAWLEPLRDVVLGAELRQTAVLFVGVVGLVLLICCVNVANLLVSRGTARQREFAIRSALGADRRRLVRQLLTESLLLAGLGGVLGLAVGAAILRVAPAIVPAELLPAVLSLSIDARVVVFCAVATLVVGLAFGLSPARQAASLQDAQQAAGTRTATRRGAGLRALLVAGQVATAVLLLCAAGLLLRTLRAVDGVERGYGADTVLTMIVDPMSSTYPTDADEVRFYDAVEREIRALPGVRGVTWATTLPLGPSYQGTVFFETVGDPTGPDAQRPTADLQIVSHTFFDTLEVPVVEGRGFDDRDTAAARPVCMVNEAFVRRHAGGRSPIGRHVAHRSTFAPQSTPDVCEVVGVAGQIKGAPTETEDLVQIYVPLAQDTPGDIYLLVTPATGSAEALITPVRQAIGRVDTAQLVSVRDILTLDAVLAEANARHRFRAVLVVAFAGLGLLLAMVGLFGILAYWVQQRIRDLGVRRALGATTGHVFWLVARQAALVIVVGALGGLAMAALAGRLMASLLFGVAPLDPVTFAIVPLVVVVGAVASMLVPAWRAAHVEPASALRAE